MKSPVVGVDYFAPERFQDSSYAFNKISKTYPGPGASLNLFHSVFPGMDKIRPDPNV